MLCLQPIYLCQSSSDFSIPVAYTKISPLAAVRRELCVFSDASTYAIAAEAYLKATDAAKNNDIGFVNLPPVLSTPCQGMNFVQQCLLWN